MPWRRAFTRVVVGAPAITMMGLGGATASATTPPTAPPVDGSVVGDEFTVTARDNCLPRATVAERTAILGGVTDDDAIWIAAFGEDANGIQMVCVTITNHDDRAVDGRIGGPFRAGADASQIVVGVMDAGYRSGARWYVVRGAVTAEAAEVTLSIDGAPAVAAELATTGPEGGWLWFALAVPQSGLAFPSVTATAYDADGAVVARGHDVFH